LLHLLSLLVASIASASTAPDAAPTFDIWEYQVDGNALLSTRDVEAAVYPHLGPRRTMADVEAARGALQEAYQRRGFGTVLVDVPEQSVEEGLVRLRVTEAQLDRVRVTGSRYRSNKRIREALTEAKPGTVPNVNALVAEIGRLGQRSRGVELTPIMRAGRAPGTVDLEVRVEDEPPLHGDLTLNNANTLNTTELRLGANLSYSNLWQRDHSLSMQYQISPEDMDEVEVLAGTYLWRPERGNHLFAFFAVDSNSDVVSLGDTNVVGNGQTFGGRAIFPGAAMLGPWSTTFVVGADYKDFADTIDVGEGVTLPTQVEYVNFATSATAIRRSDDATTWIDVGTGLGVRGLFNERTEFEEKRYKGEPNYFYATAGFRDERRIGQRYTLTTRLRGQLTGSRLISNEQFSLGGLSTVRGYLEAERLADYGLVGGLEMHRPWTSGVASIAPIDTYVFVDAGAAFVHDTLPDQDGDFWLASVGLGARTSLFEHIDLALQWALPLERAQDTRAGDQRVLFETRVGF
jgi:hemolysin activation/secretion protein